MTFGRKRRQAIDLIVGEPRRADDRRQTGAEGGGDTAVDRARHGEVDGHVGPHDGEGLVERGEQWRCRWTGVGTRARRARRVDARHEGQVVLAFDGGAQQRSHATERPENDDADHSGSHHL